MAINDRSQKDAVIQDFLIQLDVKRVKSSFLRLERCSVGICLSSSLHSIEHDLLSLFTHIQVRACAVLICVITNKASLFRPCSEKLVCNDIITQHVRHEAKN